MVHKFLSKRSLCILNCTGFGLILTKNHISPVHYYNVCNVFALDTIHPSFCPRSILPRSVRLISINTQFSYIFLYSDHFKLWKEIKLYKTTILQHLYIPYDDLIIVKLWLAYIFIVHSTLIQFHVPSTDKSHLAIKILCLGTYKLFRDRIGAYSLVTF